jgi:hypothetical protein
MIKKFKNLIVVALAGSALFAPMLVPAFASAAATDLFAANTINNAVCSGVNQAAQNSTSTSCGNNGTGNGAPDITNIATKIINILSVIVGAIAVIQLSTDSVTTSLIATTTTPAMGWFVIVKI